MDLIKNMEEAIIPKKKDEIFSKPVIVLIVIIAILLVFNQYMISGINIGRGSGFSVDVSEISQIKTTSQAVNLLFPVSEIQTDQDAINMMISQGTPEYGEAMGISFDDPTGALGLLASNYKTIKADIQQNNPEVWDRYLNLATKPVGISCEFCCGVGPIGITKSGDLKCGCKHNPAIQALTMLLMKDTDMTDAEVLREAMKWKSLWFPRDMVNIALKAAGGEVQTELPGMVGGC